jgi:RNA polymerase sigma-70 factor (ECF subfamily)
VSSHDRHETAAAEGADPLERALLTNRSRLLGFLRNLGAADAAEDILQELWVKLRGETPSGIAEPLSYLHRAAYNLFLDHRRSAVRGARRDEAWSDLAAGEGPGVSDTPFGDRVLIARERLKAAERRLDELGEPTRTIFRRHRLHGEAQRQIAHSLGLGLSTVEKHLRKAYRAMIEFQDGFDEA